MVLTTFLGAYRCSLPYYLSRVMQDLNQKTLVVDNTNDNTLFEIFKKTTDDDYVRRKNVIYVKNRVFDKEVFSKFENVFVLMGQSPDRIDFEVLKESDHLIILTEYDIFSLRQTKDILGILYKQSPNYLSNKQRDVFMVWKNKCSSKIRERDVESKWRLSVTQRFIIPMSYENEKNYIALSHNGKGSLKSLTKEYKSCLNDLADSITKNQKTRQIKRLMK